MEKLSFQEIIFKLQLYWQNYGCAILQSYDLEMGAGTFHPATIFPALGSKNWNVAYVQISRRPTDSRNGEHPNRLQHYYQFQVILKPSPDNIQELYLKSIEYLGINPKDQDIRFVEDDWESPTLGAAGLGWEIVCNGMEISQFTYMQQIAGIYCRPVVGELTYGLERLALYIQEVDEIKNICWNSQQNKNKLLYGDIDFIAEQQFSKFNLEYANVKIIIKHFNDIEQQCNELIVKDLPIPAYDYCIKASHLFNILDSRNVISVTERAAYIARIRKMIKLVCEKWLDITKSK